MTPQWFISVYDLETLYPGEQRVEAVHFLPLGDVGVVLSNALQCQLLHQVYLIGFLKVLGLEDTQDKYQRDNGTGKCLCFG